MLDIVNIIAVAGVLLNCFLTLFTAFMALATVLLVWDARKGRAEQERQRKEVAFRAAILEVTAYIVSLHEHNIVAGARFDVWWKHPFEFPRLDALLESVWIDIGLWERLTGGLIGWIKNREASLYDLIAVQNRWDQNLVSGIYYPLDLYLKQLNRYLFCEMQRQNLRAPTGLWETKTFTPLPWTYGDLNQSPAVAAAGYVPHPGLIILPAEPQNAAFDECRFERLIALAREALAQNRATVQQPKLPPGIS